MADNVRVVCRFRPQNKKEIERGGKSVVEFKDEQTVRIQGPETGDHSFSFDRSFVPSVTQQEVYELAALPAVQDTFQGYNGTVFVYGQTSSGKTHTMMGPDGGKGMDDPTLKGIIPRMAKTIFDQVENADEHMEFLVKVSYIEIYMEKVRDLLDSSKSNLAVRESKGKGIYVDGATEVYVSCEDEIYDVMRTGTNNRAVGATNMNAESSRSHSIFVVKVQQKDVRTNSVKHGKLYLVDLAGSEKVGKTGAAGQTLDEAKTINKSLSALGNVINALTDGKSKHVPYRDSKLTRILQEALGGNSKTTLIINCSPSFYNEAETVSTLRFGTRAKSIKNQAKVNEDKSVAEYKIIVNNMQKEVRRLKGYIGTLEKELIIVKGGGEGTLQISAPTGESASTGEGESAIDHLHARIAQLEAKIENFRFEKQQLVEELTEASDKLSEMEAEAEMQIERLEALEGTSSTYKHAAAELKQENQKLIQKMASEEIELDRLRDLNGLQEKALAEARAQQEGLKAEKAQLVKEVGEIRQRLETVEAERQRTVAKEEKLRELSAERDEWEEKENLIRDSLDASFEGVDFGVAEDLGPGLGSDDDDDEMFSLADELADSLAKEPELGVGEPTVWEAPQPSAHPAAPAAMKKEVEQLRAEAAHKMAEFDDLKRVLLQDLQERCERVVDLEMLLDEAKQQYDRLLNNIKSRAMYKQNGVLTKKLEQLTVAHKELLGRHDTLSVEAKVAERKLADRDSQVAKLAEELKALQDLRESETKQHEQEVSQYRQLLESARRQRSTSSIGGGVVKPLKGGSRKVAKTPSRGGLFSSFFSPAPKKAQQKTIEMQDADDVFDY